MVQNYPTHIYMMPGAFGLDANTFENILKVFREDSVFSAEKIFNSFLTYFSFNFWNISKIFLDHACYVCFNPFILQVSLRRCHLDLRYF